MKRLTIAEFNTLRGVDTDKITSNIKNDFKALTVEEKKYIYDHCLEPMNKIVKTIGKDKKKQAYEFLRNKYRTSKLIQPVIKKQGRVYHLNEKLKIDETILVVSIIKLIFLIEDKYKERPKYESLLTDLIRLYTKNIKSNHDEMGQQA